MIEDYQLFCPATELTLITDTFAEFLAQLVKLIIQEVFTM